MKLSSLDVSRISLPPLVPLLVCNSLHVREGGFDLEPIVSKYREYKQTKEDIEAAKEILETSSDEEFRELAKMELSEKEADMENIQSELKILMLPKDPNDDKNVIVEIRGGAGGDEAALFAGVLFRMYSMYASSKEMEGRAPFWNETGIGGAGLSWLHDKWKRRILKAQVRVGCTQGSESA